MRSKWMGALGFLTGFALLWAVFGGAGPAVASPGGHPATTVYAKAGAPIRAAGADLDHEEAAAGSGGTGYGEGPE